MARRRFELALRLLRAAAVLAIASTAGCAARASDPPPPTIAPARAADSPPQTGPVPGTTRPVAAGVLAVTFDAATASLVLLTGGPRAPELALLPRTGPAVAIPLPQAASAMAGAGPGQVCLSTRGGYLRVDLASRTVIRVAVDGQESTDFTAIARRADGRVVLGSADGAVITLAGADDRRPTAAGTRLQIFARVDDIVTQGNTAVVLDRGQTSVTSLNAEGTAAEHALRAGDGATTMTADSAGRVLVTDTRGGELLVYGVDPLILRQRYPVPGAPFGLTASGRPGPALAWVAQTATNTVVGYDLATGIPVEKVRYRTVRQPNSLAFDDASDTLYVVSGAGAGVQAIAGAGGAA